MKLLRLLPFLGTVLSYTNPPPQTKTTRRDLFGIITSTTTATATLSILTPPTPSIAFDGSGSSAYAGRTPSSKIALKKSYADRIVADARDFNNLGRAINVDGVTDGDEWISFFIPFKRREPDAIGRTYAAYPDLVGSDEAGGGCGLLYAGTFVKPGKPAEGTPPYKKFLVLAKALEAIKVAGKSGDLAKAKVAWGKAKDSFEDFLGVVELPSSLSDPVYN